MAVSPGPLHLFEYRVTDHFGHRYILRDAEFSKTHIWGEYRLESGKVWRGIGSFRRDTSIIESTLPVEP